MGWQIKTFWIIVALIVQNCFFCNTLQLLITEIFKLDCYFDIKHLPYELPLKSTIRDTLPVA